MVQMAALSVCVKSVMHESYIQNEYNNLNFHAFPINCKFALPCIP